MRAIPRRADQLVGYVAAAAGGLGVLLFDDQLSAQT
jgi:hypothetical protein